MLDGVLEPQGTLLGCQRSRTSYFFGPVTASAICFLLEGLPHPLQEPLGVSSSSTQEWALARDQQEAEKEKEEGSLWVRLIGLLGERRLVPPLHELPQTWASFWSHLFFLVI